MTDFSAFYEANEVNRPWRAVDEAKQLPNRGGGWLRGAHPNSMGGAQHESYLQRRGAVIQISRVRGKRRWLVSPMGETERTCSIEESWRGEEKAACRAWRGCVGYRHRQLGGRVEKEEGKAPTETRVERGPDSTDEL